MHVQVDNRFKWKYFKYTVISIVSVLTFLTIWEVATDVMHLVPSYALPSPVKVLKTFITKWTVSAPDGSTLLEHLWSSFKLAMTAYVVGALAGILLGILMGWFKTVNIMFRPLIDFIRPIPPIALIPVMIMTLGIGFKARVAVIFFAVFNGMVLNTYAGIKQTKDIHLWVSRTFGASNLQQLFTVAIPSAKPMIFTGLRSAMAGAWMSVVAAEMLAAGQGIGYMISISRTLARPDIVIVGILILGAIGLIIAKVFDILEKRLVKGGI